MRKRIFLLCLILTAITVSTGWAEETRRIERTTVSGMPIMVQKTDSAVAEVVLLLKSGSGLDPADKKGTALIMNSLVWLKLNASKRSLGEIEVETFPDYSLIKIITAAANLKPVLNEIKELLSYPLYSYDIITDLKGLFSTDLKATSALAKAYYQFNQEFYGQDHPYNIQLIPEAIEKINGNDVYKWYRQTYQPGNAVLSISGGVKISIKDLQKIFGNMISDNLDNRLMVKPIQLSRNTQIEQQDVNSKVASICIGFPAPKMQDPEFPAFRVIAYFLEEYQHYFEEIRVKDGLIYAGFVVYDYLTKPMAPNITFLTMTEPKLVGSVEARTIEILEKISVEGICTEELDKVRKAIKAQNQLEQAAGKGMAAKNVLNYYLGTTMVYDESLFPKIEKLTPEDIKKAAAKYLKNYIRVAYIPEG